MGIGFSFFFCHKSWVNSWRKKNVATKKIPFQGLSLFFLKLSINANSSETTSVIYRISFQWTKRVWIHTQREELGGKKGAELYLSDNSPRWFFPYQFFVFHLQSQKLPLFAMSFTRISSLQRSREIKSFNKWRFTWRYAQQAKAWVFSNQICFCSPFGTWDVGNFSQPDDCSTLMTNLLTLKIANLPPKLNQLKKVSGDTHPTRHSENPSL